MQPYNLKILALGDLDFDPRTLSRTQPPIAFFAPIDFTPNTQKYLVF